MNVLGLIFIAVMFILVGNILKPLRRATMSFERKWRIRNEGKLRRVCDFHRANMEKLHMAVLDEENCDYCVRLKKLMVVK